MTRPTIVLTSAVPWSGTTARPQHFARGLAERGWNVLFVNPPVTWLSPLKNPSLRQRLLPRQSLHAMAGTMPAAETMNSDGGRGQVRVLSPVAVLPFGNMYRTVNRWNQALLAQQIRTACPGPYILLPMLPTSVDLIPHLSPVAVVYDCVDFHAHFEGWIAADVVDGMERALVYQSRFVYATADRLKQRMEQWHCDVRLLPNAAEVDHFATAATAAEHPLLKNIPGPRVGFVGGIGSWVDQAFIAGLAQQLSDIHFVLIGPVETSVEALQQQPNVHFLGLQPYAELPQFLAGFAATLVAFRNNELSQAVNPIKVYEYLAAGREVVSTPIHEITSRMSDYVWLARNADEGVAALLEILNGRRRAKAEDVANFLRANTWSARVDTLHEALFGLLPAANSQRAAD
ncbi:glycosyltransferase [Alicyclobacillus contaminans]|uniref:glycosyltransferase n=1 Tax=Alicyclobacillus contaminans TaxID=392016 RepID=UPI0004261FBC|nr:glycosyltransferase [Alicyclobacillus contaminans]